MIEESRTRRPRRPEVSAKYLHVGSEKLWVRGVTYGTFRPDACGNEYGDPGRVGRDLGAIAANGFNAIRTYTVPPRWFMDQAERFGLRVMVGLPWEQHVAFLDDGARRESIERRVRAAVRACAGHPAILWYAIGNEIPAPIVRWHGRRRVERFLERLYRVVKDEDPSALVTYVNYPTTEYLELPFLDVVCFNVYLESEDRLAAYLARLQNLVGDRPLVMSELGLDSRRHGAAEQARALAWQVRTTFAAGAAGAFVFGWTDEWHRGGFDIDDWDFGLTDRDRRPKPALAAVRRAMMEAPLPRHVPLPRISVVVCTYNGARTIRDCLEGLRRLDYPNFEVIVVNDGSSDATPAIVGEYGFRVISGPNRGLSHARNVGLHAASGEIVAYIDDDAYPDSHWLRYLADSFLGSPHVGIGGPNLPPPGDGLVAESVANAPGGPIHVLLSDREAEHIPGCNMAFRRSALLAIGGFDPQFRTAGDDVDVCWRLRDRGWTLGFHPGAVVWHHRRNSMRTYWRQQVGYGRAEAMLERKWPEKYNSAGHVSWAGRLYGLGVAQAIPWRRDRLYQGSWGGALFQSLYRPSPGTLAALPLMPEWYLAILILALLSALGRAWPPLLVALPVLGLSIGALVVQAALSSARSRFARAGRSRTTMLKLYGLTALLYLVQPVARLRGRLTHGLTPWRRRGASSAASPWPRTCTLWRERGRTASEHLTDLTQTLRQAGAAVRAGGDFDRWDLEARLGSLAAVRVLMATEEHGGGRQLLRFRLRPRVPPFWAAQAALSLAGGAAAAASGAWVVGLGLMAAAGLVIARSLSDSGRVIDAVQRALDTVAVEALGQEQRVLAMVADEVREEQIVPALVSLEALGRERRAVDTAAGEVLEEQPVRWQGAIRRVA
jgi:GT2 family glycosyltransferase